MSKTRGLEADSMAGESARRGLEAWYVIRFPCLTVALLLVVLLHWAGFFALTQMESEGLTQIHLEAERQLNVFHILFARQAPAGLYLSLAILALAALLPTFFLRQARRGSGGAPETASGDPADGQGLSEGELSGRGPARSWPAWESGAGRWLLALAVAAATWWATLSVYHDYPLSMDEHGAEMQAEIFRSGQLMAPVPAPWHELREAITPTFFTLTESGSWISWYLPVYALFRALSLVLHPSMLLNPLLAGWAVLLIGAIARRLFPERLEAPWIVAVLLACSSQFVITSASFYSMPAHLALNLLWLWLYLQDRRWSWAALVGVGVLAMGLHQFVMHCAFALPFLVRLVLRRRWLLSAAIALPYGMAILGWSAWIQKTRVSISVGELGESWGWPGFQQVIDQAANLSNVITWQAPAVALLVIVAVQRWKSLSIVVRDLAWSVAFTLVFYAFFLPNQGHGWGYRYFYPVLGNWILLAAPGYAGLCAEWGARRARLLLTVAVAGALFLQIPLRSQQVSAFIAPFAQASAYLESLDTDIVLIDSYGNWYGWDLVRNGPSFPSRPIVADSRQLDRERAQALSQLGSLRQVPPVELERFGLIVTSSEAEFVRIPIEPSGSAAEVEVDGDEVDGDKADGDEADSDEADSDEADSDEADSDEADGDEVDRDEADAPPGDGSP